MFYGLFAGLTNVVQGNLPDASSMLGNLSPQGAGFFDFRQLDRQEESL